MRNFSKLCSQVCKSCDTDCCKTFLPFLSEYDKQRIRGIIKDENIFKGNYFNVDTEREFGCPFSDEENKACLIHDYRPLDCRIYPYSFWFDFGKIELWFDLKCPAIKKFVAKKEIYNQVLTLAKKELFYWTEGEIFGYLMGNFNIEEFKKNVGNTQKTNLYSKGCFKSKLDEPISPSKK